MFERPVDIALGSLAGLRARACLRRLFREAKSARKIQEKRLSLRLRKSANSEFGRKHGFVQIKSYQDFARAVPIQTYADLQPLVERVMHGDVPALFPPDQKILMFASTSGTTDSAKYVPVTPEFLAEYRRGWSAFGFKALLDHGEAFLRPILQVTSGLSEFRAPCGLPCGAISGLLADTQSGFVRRFYAAPDQVAQIKDADARYYTIMRFAILRDVGWMVTASPATQLKLVRTAQIHAQNLIRDIADGALNPPGNIDGDLQKNLLNQLQPEPAAAKRLEILAGDRGELLPRDYWRLSFIANWTAGTMQFHLHDFPRYFGEVPVRDIGLLATEGRVTIALDDQTAGGVLDIGGSFFEFVECGNASDRAVVRRCHELEVGREYRVLMTTSAGFFRYDIGDHVLVTGYLGEAPILEFLHRGAHVSSITGEKITEWQVITAMEKCMKSARLRPCPFLIAPVWSDPPFYRIHVEESDAALAEYCGHFDKELARLNVEYASKRQSGRLSSVQVHVVQRGAFAKMDRDRLLRGGGVGEQFKPKFLYNRPGDDAFLLDLSSRIDDLQPAENIRTPQPVLQ